MPASSLYSMEIYTQRSICNSLSALARSLAYSHQSSIRSCTITDNLINPECPAMRTFVPARVVVYIIHIPMSANIYIPGCTTSFPECLTYSASCRWCSVMWLLESFFLTDFIPVSHLVESHQSCTIPQISSA